MSGLTKLDAVTLEVILNGLRSITDETFIALMKTAYSTNIKERNDHSTAIIDPTGRIVALCERSQPVHLSSMLGLTSTLLTKFALSDFRPGDIFAANDPYVAGGSHLPDVNLSMPIFVDGKLLCFMCNIAHHADIGGMAPGSMSGGMTEIYQEGLRIPPVRLFAGGELQTDILDIFLLNARVPEERRGDYFAQIASCKLGERRIIELATEYGVDTLSRAFDELIERTHTRTIAAIKRVPAGVYKYTDVMDDDGFGTFNIPITVEVTVGDPATDGRIRVDFTGSSDCVKGNINVPYRTLQSSVIYVVRALLDPEVPSNQGLVDAIEITAPLGTIVNASFPAAVGGRANTCQRVVDTILGALTQALPQDVVAASNGANTMATLSGNNPVTGRPYIYLETFGGGFGGRASKDGKDGVQVHLINTSNLPVEAIENEYPLLIESYGFVEDSGGAGTFRGGLGLRRVIRPVGHTMVFTGQGERFLNHPPGVFGGEPGEVGRFFIQEADGSQTELQGKPGPTLITPDQAIGVETAGAGGYGDPSKRTSDALALDQISGKFSESFLSSRYAQRKRDTLPS